MIENRTNAPPTRFDAIGFSVAIPLYNKGAHIARAIESVLGQSTPAAEIIVVDDGSTDDGPAIARSFTSVRFIERGMPGPGGYAARNEAIRHASSDWIAFLDADDEWMPDHLHDLARAIAGASERPVLAATGHYEKSGADVRPGRFARRFAGHAAATLPYHRFLELWLDLAGCPVWTSAIAARRDILREVGMFPADRCRRGGDKDLWLRMARAGPSVIVPDISAIYHKDSENMVTNLRHVNECHCMAATISEQLRFSTDPAERSLLRRLHNTETFKYALRTARAERLSSAQWSGFHVRENPLKFLMLAALSTRVGAGVAKTAAARGWRLGR
jgi:glycosyltransferase involved in cell wall biosynthesis